MGLAKTGYSDANQGTTRASVPIDSSGYIVDKEDAAGTKNFTINHVNPENTLEQNTEVLNFFVGLINSETYSNTNRLQVTWTV